MSKPDFDVAVIGQGIAGCTLAWHLRWLGLSVVTIDRADGRSASRIAAGLITPVTGQRLASTPNYAQLLPLAAAFYRRVENETGSSLFFPCPAIRILGTAVERERYQTRSEEEFRGLVRYTTGELDPAIFCAPHGEFAMPTAARVDIPKYLAVTAEAGMAPIQSHIDAIEPAEDWVDLPQLGIRVGMVVFCEGIAGRFNRWFPDLGFNPAKGEILTLDIPGLRLDGVIHGNGLWLAPLAGGRFLAGATYDRDMLDNHPTSAGRDWILARLRSFLRPPVRVVDHTAAVRPILASGVPVAEFHTEYPRLVVLNGLGSKGALLAPALAGELARGIVGRLETDSRTSY